MFEPGSILDSNSIAPDRFTLLYPLGAGGMGSVYLAYDKLYDSEVALKVLTVTYSANRSAAERLLREARLMRELKHPNLVRTFDVGIYNDRPFFTMEFINGKNLRDLVGEKPVPWQQTASLLKQVAEGLTVVHSAGIIHRDLKPSNILISGDVAKILDFGAAYVKASDLTRSSDLIGSPLNFPPELLTSNTFGTYTDIFALGVLAYELTTGQRPFKGESLGELFYAVVHEEPVPPARLADMPQDFSQLILSMLAKTPEQRPASAAQLVNLLASWPASAPLSCIPSRTNTTNETGTGSSLPDPGKMLVEVTLQSTLLLLANMLLITTCHSLLNLIPFGMYFVSIISMLFIACTSAVLHRKFFKDVLRMNPPIAFTEIGIRLAVTVYSSFLVILIGLSEVINYQVVEHSVATAGEIGLTSFWCIVSLTPCGTEALNPTKYNPSELPLSSAMMILLFTYLLNWGLVNLLLRVALCSTDIDRLCNSESINRLARFIVAGFMAELLIVEIASARFGERSYWLPFLFGLANISAIYVSLFNIKNARPTKHPEAPTGQLDSKQP